MSSKTDKPGVYRRPVPTTWFMANQNYTIFMARELSAIPIAMVVLLHLWALNQMGQGPEGYAAAVALLKNPLVILFHLVALAFTLLHTVTWFKLNAQILEIRQGEKVVPRSFVIGATYLAWGLVSIAIFWILVG